MLHPVLRHGIPVLGNFNAAMAAAAANPAGYDISYNYYINTATCYRLPTFLQVGTFVNTGSGYYAQDYGSPNELQLNGTQMASGQVFTGTVTVNVGASILPRSTGGASLPTGARFRIAFQLNGPGVVRVDFTDISVDNLRLVMVPEPASIALCGLGLAAGITFLRRRNA